VNWCGIQQVKFNKLNLLFLAFIRWVSHEVLDEALVFHGAVAVDFDTFEDLVNFVLLEGFSEGGKDVLDFDGQNVSVAFFVEDFHTFEEILFGTGGWELRDNGEDWEKLVESDLLAFQISFGWFAVLVTWSGTVKGALPLFVGWGPAEGSDGTTDLAPVDFAFTFVIEEFPVIFPLFDLIAAELVCHLEFFW
jgi:hypothetical protein